MKYEGEKQQSILSSTLDNLFMKAVTQSIFCPYYVLFLKIFIENKIELQDVIKEKCDKFKNILVELDEEPSRVKTVTDENYDDFCKDLKQKNFKLGFSQFVGELYNNKLISPVVLLETIDIILENINNFVSNNGDLKSEFIEDNVICLCKIIETLKDKFVVETYIEKLNTIQKQKGLPKRLGFALMDTVESIEG